MDEIPATIRTATEQFEAVNRRWLDAAEPFARQVREIQKAQRQFDELAAPLRELAALKTGPAGAVKRIAEQLEKVAELTRIPGIEMLKYNDLFGPAVRVPDFDPSVALNTFVPDNKRVADLEARVELLETENTVLAAEVAQVQLALMGGNPPKH